MTRLIFAPLALALVTSTLAAADGHPTRQIKHAAYITAAGVGIFLDGTAKTKIASKIAKGNSDTDDRQICDIHPVRNNNDLSVMIENGVVTSVIIHTKRYATAEGVRIGNSDSDLKRIYGKRLSRIDSIYQDAPAAIYTLSGPHHTKVVFDVNQDHKIGEIRTGRSAPYVEGCL